MVRQLEKEYFNNYAWMDRSNVGMGYYVNLPFAFADLDDLCKDIERELDSRSLGAGFTSQGQKIDEFAEHRGYLLRYINDVLYDISDYLETPLYKGFNDAMDHMAGIDMTDGKTDNTIGLQTNVSVYGGGRGYGFENDMPYLTLEDFIGSRYQETEGSSYESTTYNQKVEGFADLFAEDYENLVKSGKINGKEVTLEKYLDSLVLKEFAYKKDSPFYLELIELLSELTVVIPIYEAAVGKTLITNDYLTDTEGAFKIVSATVNLVTLGQGALISEGGMAFAKMFASEVLAEAVAGSTAILSDKAGAPSSVTIALSLLAGAGAGMAANKALFNGYGSKAVSNVVEGSGKKLKPGDPNFMGPLKEVDAARTANWTKPDGSTWWPPNDGAVPGTEKSVSLQKGTEFGRIGGEWGSYVAPPNTLPEKLALRPGTDTSVYNEYRAIKEIPRVQQAEVASWFDMPGGGTQYKLPASIKDLVEAGYIELIIK